MALPTPPSAPSATATSSSLPLPTSDSAPASRPAPSTTTTTHPPHLLALTSQIAHNLTHQHDWTHLATHLSPHPRPLLSGLPPTPIYIHPDTQIRELLHPESHPDKEKVETEREWVLPTHIRETWTLRRLAGVFDSLPEREGRVGEEGEVEKKRVLLATMNDDSTIVYYIVHDGVVKPRQN